MNGDGGVMTMKTVLPPTFQSKKVTQEHWDNIFGKKRPYWEKNKTSDKPVDRRPG